MIRLELNVLDKFCTKVQFPSDMVYNCGKNYRKHSVKGSIVALNNT